MKLDLNQDRERINIYEFIEDITGKCINCNVSLFHHRQIYKIKLESRERRDLRSMKFISRCLKRREKSTEKGKW